MKFVGLHFLKEEDDTFAAQHFVLLNSKGSKIWESPHKKVKVSIAKDTIYFPNYNLERTLANDVFQISNSGRVLQLKSGREGVGTGGWTLYDAEGHMVKNTKTMSNKPIFSNDGNRFLINEKSESDDDKWEDDIFGTSCYNKTGKLQWRKEEIVPLPDMHYVSSTTGKYFIAGYRIGKGVITQCKIDWCIIDKDGNLVSRRNYPEKWLDARIRFHGLQLTDEPEIFGPSGFKDKNFETKFCSSRILKAKRAKFGRLISRKLLPLNNKYFVAAGFMRSDSKRKFDPYGGHKFFAIIDKEGNLQGLKIIDTGLTNNRTFRLKVDEKTLKFYLYTNDVSIEAQFEPEKGQD
ncbi:hypothetical protein K8T06_07835 [bacterium]|nr:hypothetical protein [bacterium]